MIFEDKNKQLLTDAFFKDDKIVFEHAELLDPTLEYVKTVKEEQARSGHDGYNEDRTQRYMGTIPPSIFEIHKKEWMADPNKILDWFDTEEGKPYCVNPKDTGKSGKIIVK